MKLKLGEHKIPEEIFNKRCSYDGCIERSCSLAKRKPYCLKHFIKIKEGFKRKW